MPAKGNFRLGLTTHPQFDPQMEIAIRSTTSTLMFDWSLGFSSAQGSYSESNSSFPRTFNWKDSEGKIHLKAENARIGYAS